MKPNTKNANKTIVPLAKTALTIMVVGACIFSLSENMPDSNITPKWFYFYLTSGIVVIALGIYCLIFKNWIFEFDSHSFAKILCALSVAESLIGIFQFYSLGHFHTFPPVVGTFDNPAGFAICICFGMPFISYTLYNSNGGVRDVICAIIILTALLISQSRIGVLTAIALLTIPAMHKFSNRLNRKILMTIAIFAILTIFSYLINTNSANGRFLIWQCCYDMFCDAPFFGHGLDCFRREYMDYQAAFFKMNPDSNYSILADNVQYTYNEYINLAITFGLTGLTGLTVLIVLVSYILYRTKLRITTATLLLLSVAILSMTSYPFAYPLTWLVCILSIVSIIRFPKPKTNFGFKITGTVAILTGVLLTGYSHLQISAEHDVYNALIKNELNDYTILNEKINHKPYHMYNLAQTLYINGNIDESFSIAMECRKTLADYDLELLIANLYLAKGQFNDALYHYGICSNMCPCRFIPLYQQFYIYHIQGNVKMAKELATEISSKPEKIPSIATKKIKLQATRFLTNLKH